MTPAIQYYMLLEQMAHEERLFESQPRYTTEPSLLPCV